jgi:hypothetical protein
MNSTNNGTSFSWELEWDFSHYRENRTKFITKICYCEDCGSTNIGMRQHE